MSEHVAISLIGAVIALLGTVFSGILALLMAGLKQRADAAAVAAAAAVEAAKVVASKVAKVATTLAATTSVTEHKLDTIPTLVNSAMGTALRQGALVARRLATLTNHTDDLRAAEQAESMLREHEARQAVVDANTPPAPPRAPSNFTPPTTGGGNWP